MVVPSLHCTSAQEISPSPFLHTIRAHSTHGSRGSISIQAQTPKSCLSCAVGIPWPRLVPCCRSSLTGSSGCSPAPSVALDWTLWMDSGPNHHLTLAGTVNKTLLPPSRSAHPAQMLQDCALIGEVLPVLGSPSTHSLPSSWCSSAPAAP